MIWIKSILAQTQSWYFSNKYIAIQYMIHLPKSIWNKTNKNLDNSLQQVFAILL